MIPLETRLDAYPALPPDERAAIDAAARSRADLAEQYAEAVAFAALLDAATSEADRAAQHAVDVALGLDTDAARDTPDPALVADAHLHLATLGAPEPADEKFERLTAGVRGRRRPQRRRGWRRWTAALALGLALGYGALWAASAAATPERALVAALGDLPSAAPADDGALQRRLDDALGTVREARRSTLGLFPRFDDDRLDAAARQLAAAAHAAGPSTPASQEARLALGRVLLHRGSDADAARVLGSLVREGGYRAPEARRLLDYVRAQGPPVAGV